MSRLTAGGQPAKTLPNPVDDCGKKQGERTWRIRTRGWFLSRGGPIHGASKLLEHPATHIAGERPTEAGNPSRQEDVCLGLQSSPAVSCFSRHNDPGLRPAAASVLALRLHDNALVGLFLDLRDSVEGHSHRAEGDACPPPVPVGAELVGQFRTWQAPRQQSDVAKDARHLVRSGGQLARDIDMDGGITNGKNNVLGALELLFLGGALGCDGC